MTIGDLTANADPRIAGVNVKPGETPNIAILDSSNIMALTIAVVAAISNGRVDFLSGTDNTATLRIKSDQNQVTDIPDNLSYPPNNAPQPNHSR